MAGLTKKVMVYMNVLEAEEVQVKVLQTLKVEKAEPSKS